MSCWTRQRKSRRLFQTERTRADGQSAPQSETCGHELTHRHSERTNEDKPKHQREKSKGGERGITLETEMREK